MCLSIGIYYESNLKVEAEYACARLQETFPNIISTVIALMEVPAAAFDTATGQYDVNFLLELLALQQHCDKVIWIVGHDIGDIWHSYLFGAALSSRAVVSSARLRCLESLAKEVCHETGHMQGLKHCKNLCCMRKSWTTEGVLTKSMAICEACRDSLKGVSQEWPSVSYPATCTSSV